jgi:adenylyltransferase/sulfurtransferase
VSDNLGSQKLQLDPLMTLVRHGADSCQFVLSERQMFRLQGRTVPVLVEHVLPLLDGTRTVLELRQALAAQLSEKALDDMLRLLLRNRVLRDVSGASVLSAEEQEAHRGVLLFLSRYSENPDQLLARLRGARVAVMGDSPFVQDVINALAACGIGLLDIVSEQTLSITPPLLTQLRSRPWEDLEATLTESDFVLGLQDGDFSSTRALKQVNQICSRLGKSWLSLRLTLDAEGWLGPVHGPGGACFECLDWRIKSNLKAGRDHAITQQHAEDGRVQVRRLEVAPFRQQLAAMAAIETLKQLTWLEATSLFSRCCIVDFITHETSLHTVLKNPACPTCGQHRGGRLLPWDADEVLLERTLIPLTEEGRR